MPEPSSLNGHCEQPEPMQVLLHPVLVEPFKAWLESRGLLVRCIGKFSDDDLPTWVVDPKVLA